MIQLKIAWNAASIGLHWPSGSARQPWDRASGLISLKAEKFR